MTAGIAYLGLALADYLWQYWQYVKELRMTKEEVKQEHKNSEGDPHLKQRMRAVARSMARRQMFRDVPKADVVIVNPTHRAIALQYDALQAPAPFVLAMGERKVAERIKKIALDHGIPVIENKPLAIALLSSARVGMMIPPELYLAVAEVLAFVIRQRRARDGAWGYRPISRLVGDSV
jgi:flagellar biosynthetic protein FlhB